MKITIKLLALICVISLLFTACGNGVSTQKIKADEIKYETADYSGDALHKADSKAYKSVCKSGLIEMLFDESTMTVAIKDTGSGNLWTSLPQNSVKKQIKSSAVEVELSNGDENIYVLNSQDNSVNFGNAVSTVSEDGVSVKYAMSLDAETGKADITTLEDKQIRVDLTVNYTLRDGSFYVNVSMNTVNLPKGVCLEKIRVLNHFGAYDNSGAEDYIFVPDGSGALIMTGVEDKEFTPLNLSVYGDDNAITENAEGSACLVGAFGMKRSNGAFLCIIESGDTIAEIEAERSTDSKLNRVGATFNVTDIATEQGKNKVTKTLGYQFKNEITLCYRFLSGRSATYSGMATACRENLIRNSVLGTKTFTTDEKYIPLVLSIQGGYINENGKYNVLTSYEQALSLATLLKAKGVNNIYLRYNGLYNEGNNGSDADFGDFSKKLGKDKDYEALYTYLKSQNFSLFLETDLLSFDYNSKGAQALYSGKVTSEENKKPFPCSNAKQSYLKMSNLEEKIEDVLSASASVSFDGYALNDAGAVLYSDYSDDFYARVTSKKDIASQLPVLATSKALMIDTGNIYSVKNADVISNIPLSPIAKEENTAYVGIPFMQMMLHGITEYNGAGLNANEDIKTAFLKSIEYGCLPSAEWYCNKFNEEHDGKYYYDSNINDIVSFYTKANEVLGDIRAERMTSHYEEQDGVYCTEYDNSTKVYVNYTDKDVTINGIKIPAMDCVKI